MKITCILVLVCASFDASDGWYGISKILFETIVVSGIGDIFLVTFSELAVTNPFFIPVIPVKLAA